MAKLQQAAHHKAKVCSFQRMDLDRIAELLRPFIGEEPLPQLLLQQVDTYVDLLLRWNARVNLTAIRDPETIVTRHFGESLFAARLITDCQPSAGSAIRELPHWRMSVPAQAFLAFPSSYSCRSRSDLNRVAEQESHFSARSAAGAETGSRGGILRRAEQWGKQATIVSLRAVEQFECVLPPR